MILGLHIEVLFANFGFLANPQPKVMNAFFFGLFVYWCISFSFVLYLVSAWITFLLVSLCKFESECNFMPLYNITDGPIRGA